MTTFKVTRRAKLAKVKTEAELAAELERELDCLPEWLRSDDSAKSSARSKSKIDVAISGLQKARAEAATQAGFVQDMVFNNWLLKSVMEVDDPRLWSSARALYEDYLEHARSLGKKVKEKRIVFQELLTETQWGRWMATKYPRRRRTSGNYYPLCKRS